MEFRFKNKDSLFIEAYTGKGNLIYFAPPLADSGNRIIYSKSLIIHCSFDISLKMIEVLHNSKIIKVESYTNEQFKIRTLFGFTIEKLKSVLIDMCQKFDL